MKTKLTVSIDKDLVPLAKSYAKGMGVSLSSLIERDLMRDLANEVSFTRQWGGALAPEVKDESRYNRLMRKHA
jgi:hypothetical protein